MTNSLFLILLSRSEDYRSFELLSECYHNLGFPEHAIEYLNSAIICPGIPFILFKKLALLYYSVGNIEKYFDFYVKYFDGLMVGDRNDIILVISHSYLLRVFIYIRSLMN